MLRYQSGKEQSLKSIKRAFHLITLSMKREINTKKFIQVQRYFSTGCVKDGALILEKQEISCCKELALRVLRRAGLIFPRESEFYEMVHPLIQNEQSFDEFTEWDWDFFNSLTSSTFQIKKNTQKNQYWYVHSSNFRLTKNVIGRNIRSRYMSSPELTHTKK